MSNKEKILSGLKNKSFLKIISGIQNYEKSKVLDVAMAAEMGGASALDICDDLKIIKDIRAAVSLSLFVSSVEPEKLLQAQKLGVDVLEIGNYESFYKIGKLFTPKEILEIAMKVKFSIKEDVLLCVTIPSTLEVENQVKLGKELVKLGVDILQTEGFTPDTPASDRQDEVYTSILKAASSLANTKVIRDAIPYAKIITASGITPTTVPLAIALGASGVGVGTYINSLTTQAEMIERVQELALTITDKQKILESTKTPVLT